MYPWFDLGNPRVMMSKASELRTQCSFHRRSAHKQKVNGEAQEVLSPRDLVSLFPDPKCLPLILLHENERALLCCKSVVEQ